MQCIFKLCLKGLELIQYFINNNQLTNPIPLVWTLIKSYSHQPLQLDIIKLQIIKTFNMIITAFRMFPSSMRGAIKFIKIIYFLLIMNNSLIFNYPKGKLETIIMIIIYCESVIHHINVVGLAVINDNLLVFVYFVLGGSISEVFI